MAEECSLQVQLQELIDNGNDMELCTWADKNEESVKCMFSGEQGLALASEVLLSAATNGMSQFLRKVLLRQHMVFRRAAPKIVNELGVAGNSEFCDWVVDFAGSPGCCCPGFVAETIRACQWALGSGGSELLQQTCFSLLHIVKECPDLVPTFHRAGVFATVARSGWLDMARRLIELGVNPCAGNEEGYSALHMACIVNDADMVLYLLSVPAVCNSHPMALRDRLGRTPLAAWACHGSNSLSKDKHRAVLGKMLELNADVNAPMERGRQALGSAVAMGAAGLVEALLQAGADCSAQDLDQRTALHYACLREYGKSPEIILLLLKAGANPQMGGLSPAVQIVDTGRSSAFMVDLAQPETAAAQEAGVTPNKLRWQFTQWPPILTSVRQGDLGNLAALVSGGADPNAGTRQCLASLHVAALHDKPEAMRMLLDAGAHHSCEGPGTPPPLHFAAFAGSERCTRLLLEAGAVPSASAMALGATPAHWAAAHGSVDVILLLSQFPEVLLRAADDGSTPLMRAASAGHNEVVALLLSFGAPLSRRDNGGRRACDMASTLDLRTELTPLPRLFVEDEILPASGAWLVTETHGPDHVTNRFLTAEAAIRAVLKRTPGVGTSCSFLAVPMDAAETQTSTGSGGFGSISLGMFASSGQACAIKSLHTAGLSAVGVVEKQRDLAYEIRVQQSVGAALRLARVFGTTQRSGVTSSVSDFIPGVTWDWFCKLPRDFVSDEVRLQLANSLMDAIIELGDAEVAHRDIHGANVMVYINTAGIWQVALVDFGLSFQWSMRVDGYSAKALSSLHIGLHPPSKLHAPDGNSLHWQRCVDLFGAACLMTWLCGGDSIPSRDEWLPAIGSFGDALADTWQHWARQQFCKETPSDRLPLVVLALLGYCGVDVAAGLETQHRTAACSRMDYADQLKIASTQLQYDQTDYKQGIHWQQEVVTKESVVDTGKLRQLKCLLQL